MTQIHLLLGLPANGAKIISIGFMILALILMVPELIIWVWSCLEKQQ